MAKRTGSVARRPAPPPFTTSSTPWMQRAAYRALYGKPSVAHQRSSRHCRLSVMVLPRRFSVPTSVGGSGCSPRRNVSGCRCRRTAPPRPSTAVHPSIPRENRNNPCCLIAPTVVSDPCRELLITIVVKRHVGSEIRPAHCLGSFRWWDHCSLLDRGAPPGLERPMIWSTWSQPVMRKARASSSTSFSITLETIGSTIRAWTCRTTGHTRSNGPLVMAGCCGAPASRSTSRPRRRGLATRAAGPERLHAGGGRQSRQLGCG